MKKKNKLSYAQQAKRIVSKYKRRLGENFERPDALAEASLQRELDALMEKQEMLKQSQVESRFQEMAMGGVLPQMKWGDPLPDEDGLITEYGKFGLPSLTPQVYSGNPYVTQDYAPGTPSNAGIRLRGQNNNAYRAFTAKQSNPALPMPNGLAPTTPYDAFAYDDPNYHTGQPSFMKTAPNAPVIAGTKKVSTPQTGEKSATWWNDIPTESKIGMGAQLAGVLGQGLIAATAGKPKPMKYNPVTMAPPEQMRSDEQLNQATRAFKENQAKLRYLSPSQYMAALNDSSTREAGVKAGIVENVENQNVDIRNQDRMLQARLAQENEQMRLGVDQYNEAERQGYVSNLGQFAGNLAGVVSGAASDEGLRLANQEALQFMGNTNHKTVQINGRNVIATAATDHPEFDYYTPPRGKVPIYRINGTPVSKDKWDKALAKKIQETNALNNID